MAAAATRILRRPRRSEILPCDQGGDDQDRPTGRRSPGRSGGVRRRRAVSELLQQVVGLVGHQERVGGDEQEAADERPGEVGVPARVDVERLRRARRSDQGGRSAGSRRRSRRRAANSSDAQAADRARGQEHAELASSNSLDEIGRRPRRRPGGRSRGPRRRGRAGRPAPGRASTATWAASSALRKTCASAPADQHHADARCEGDRQWCRPCPPARPSSIQGRRMPEPGRGPVAEPAEQRVAHHREQRADPGDEGEAPGCLVDAHEVVDLESEGDQQRAPGRAATPPAYDAT